MPDPWVSGLPSTDNNGLPPGMTAPPAAGGGGDGFGEWLGGLWNSFAQGQQGPARSGPFGIPPVPPVYDPSWWSQVLGQQGPDDQLVQQIYDKIRATRGEDIRSTGGRGGYNVNLALARQAAARARTDASFRQQLVAYMGWNATNPDVQRWVNTGGPPPSEKAVAPTGGPGTGVSGTGPAPTDPSAAKVQSPFPAQYFNQPGYQGNNFGDYVSYGTGQSGAEPGQDYGVPAGTPLSFPFAGKVVATGYDPSYGNYVKIEFGDQGMTMMYAHLSTVGVRDGDTVTPGQDVAISGETGHATGPHLEVVLADASGRPLDPRPLLTEIYSGATLGQMQKLGYAQTGAGSTGSPITTPDGHVIWPGTPDDAYYTMISAPYEHYYGTKPPWALALALRQQGVQNTDQMAAIAANWPSDIPGVSFATRENIYNTANQIAMKNWGRPIPDALVKQLGQSGNYSTDAIKEWFDTHVPTDLPPADYQQLYDAVNPQFQKTYGTGPMPDYIGYLWGKTQAPVTPAATPATTPPATVQAG